MNIHALASHLYEHLQCSMCSAADTAINGLQVERRNLEIKRVACAVDATEESIQRAAEWGADMLLVHHGIFWGAPVAIIGSHYRRVRALLNNEVALMAFHLPLDRHATLGNNIGMARALALVDIQPFGKYYGIEIGYRGKCPRTMTTEEIAGILFGSPSNTLRILNFGTEPVNTVGILSGGGVSQISQAVAAGLDLYITGDAAHTVYHYALEEQINVIFGGHYLTEVWGVQSMATYLQEALNLESIFIDLPTAL